LHPFFYVLSKYNLLRKQVFFETPLNLHLSTNVANGAIRYTLDGSKPTTLTVELYNGTSFNVDSTTVVRTIAFSGITQSNIETYTYIFLDDVVQQPTDISGWPNTIYDLGTGDAQDSHDYEMDPNIVNHPAYSEDIIPRILSIPTMSIVMFKDDFLAMYEGEARFPRSVEILYPGNAFPNKLFGSEVESHSHLRLKRSMKLDINSSINSNGLKTNPLTVNFATINFTDTNFVLRGGNSRTNTIRGC
jgi:hypothetical protein